MITDLFMSQNSIPCVIQYFPFPFQGEHIWRTEDIINIIEEQGDSIALVWLPGMCLRDSVVEVVM